MYKNEQALYAEGGYWALQEAGLFFAVAGVRPGLSIDAVESTFFEQIEAVFLLVSTVACELARLELVILILRAFCARFLFTFPHTL